MKSATSFQINENKHSRNMRKSFLSEIIVAISIILFTNCTKATGYPESKTNTPTANTCDSSAITYTNFVAGVMSSNCTFSGCHDSGSSFDLTTYAGVKLKVDDESFKRRVFDLKDMPPTYSSGPKSLDDCTIGKLKKWINNGAPQ
jgi:hypothetical protein